MRLLRKPGNGSQLGRFLGLRKLSGSGAAADREGYSGRGGAVNDDDCQCRDDVCERYPDGRCILWECLELIAREHDRVVKTHNTETEG
jgi:hypothetical protein